VKHETRFSPFEQIVDLKQRMRETEELLQARIRLMQNPHLANGVRYQELLANASVLVFQLDSDGTVYSVNDVVCRVTGYATRNLRGKNWWDLLVSPEQAHQVAALYLQWHAGDVARQPLTLTARDGTLVTLEVTTANRYDAQGRLERIVALGMVQTSRAEKTDALVRQFQEQATNAGEKTDALVRQFQEQATNAGETLALVDTLTMTASIGMAFLDCELRFVHINRLLAEIHGLPVAEHVGRTMQEVAPQRADALEPLFRRVLETGEPIINLELNGETAAWSGVERHWQASFCPVSAADGQIVGVGIVVQDITERKQAEAVMRAGDELLAIVSHDLKNPLTVIKGRAGLLQRQVRSMDTLNIERVSRTLQQIENAAMEMVTQINEVLDMARLRMGKSIDLRLQSLDLVALVHRLADAHQQTTTRHTLRVDTTLPELIGLWDESRLERVIANLLTNALKYSPDGGNIILAVSCEEAVPGCLAVLTVSDEGMGIPAVDLPHIFGKFHRAGNVDRHIQGSGLGLTSAQQIVAQHRGTISVTSDEGRGSTFTIRLPLKVEA